MSLAEITLSDRNERGNGLIEATLTCIAEEGISNATVRKIANYAGVSNGLIRFYFKTKDGIIQAAYQRFLERIFNAAYEAMEEREGEPVERLRTFLGANLSPPIVTPEMVLLWANFLPLTYQDARMTEIREQWYNMTTRSLRELIREALAAEQRVVSDRELRHLSMAINGMIDGLWIEGALSTDKLVTQELREVGLNTAAKILGLESLSVERS
ncbi:TetR family transcriptional regulator C-terminal domain-containing protein [Halomonas zhaodongensis]|uniref:TetR family transcriptional regulator C-terminal domain-containing protein n=2 Tax=Vreelandella zhaodongensis TaxID=1176240 RepID=A0ABX2SSA8_VREZH|nr:TetR family transcriptional regulator C-terminal domain-containing protein [Halomonas zhaodongensis]NYS44502.1 TetR family transcriptional regulator C-terminal domain-containing protein [Halomonas zhaodongensis]